MKIFRYSIKKHNTDKICNEFFIVKISYVSKHSINFIKFDSGFLKHTANIKVINSFIFDGVDCFYSLKELSQQQIEKLRKYYFGE